MEWSRVPAGSVDWAALDRLPDRTIFQTQEWLAFLGETQRCEPVIAVLSDGGEQLGWFTGAIVRKFGVRILGSPFTGWTTSYMGFNLRAGVSRRHALAELPALAFEELGCSYLQILDRHTQPTDVPGGFEVVSQPGFYTNLTLTEDVLFAAMTSACRRCIRKAERSLLTIEEADDVDFAAEYYQQLCDVFAKQRLVPTYGEGRVRALMSHLQPTGRLLCIRARDAAGRCIATGIYPALGQLAYFWGNASYRADQHLRPNEALHWYAMRYWKKRGVAGFDWGGGGNYKAKYGGTSFTAPILTMSRGPLTSVARRVAENSYYMYQSAAGRLRSHRRMLLSTSGESQAQNEEEL